MLIDNDTTIKLGETNISKVYLGESVVYESTSPEPSYTELEYIEATGTQYIALPLTPTNHWVETKFSKTTTNPNNCIFGTDVGLSSPNYWHFTYFSSKWYWGTNGSEHSSFSGSPNLLNTPRVLKYNYGENNQVILDDVVLESGSTITATSTMNWFFRGKESGAHLYGKFYYGKIYDKTTNELVYDFIPVLDSKDVPCMYDKVEKKFYYNAGTGTFLYE